MSDDPRRLRLRAAPPAVSVPPPPGAPALLGRVTTTTAAALGPGKFFKIRRYTITGAEVEGGSATLTAGPTPPVYVLARNGTPATNGLIVASQVPYRWVWTPPTPPCTYNDICVVVVDADGPIADVPVTIHRMWLDTAPDPDVDHAEAYTDGDGTTDAAGRRCFRVPITLADPSTAPTVDPLGGGTSGNTAAIGAYRAAHSWVTHFGETRTGPPSAEFQVGVPDPTAYPVVTPTFGNTGARTGSLAAGVYWVKVSYSDAAGATRPSAAVRVAVGMADLSGGGFGVVTTPGTGLLAAGTYLCRYAGTDGAYETAPANPGGFTLAAGEVAFLSGAVTRPIGVTGFNVYLSDNAGATWHRYLSNVLPGTDGAIYFDIALPGATATPPSGNTFPVLDPRITLPAMATARPNATGARLWMNTAATGTFSDYGATFAGDTVDLLDAYSANSTHPATTNTTARNKPTATAFSTSADAIGVRVYVVPVPAGTPCVRYRATAAPLGLFGTPESSAFCPPAINTTGGGRWRATVEIPDTEPRTNEVRVTGQCGSYEIRFGPCPYGIPVNFTFLAGCCVDAFTGIESATFTVEGVVVLTGHPNPFGPMVIPNSVLPGTTVDYEVVHATYGTITGSFVLDCAGYGITHSWWDYASLPDVLTLSGGGDPITLTRSGENTWIGSKVYTVGYETFTINFLWGHTPTTGPHCRVNPSQACGLRISFLGTSCHLGGDTPTLQVYDFGRSIFNLGSTCEPLLMIYDLSFTGDAALAAALDGTWLVTE